MRMRYLVAAVAAALVGGPAVAQPPEPTVEVRLRSVNDLLDKAEYVGGLLDKEDPVKQARGLVQQLSEGGKGVEGVDPKRPFGAYAVVASDIEASQVVVMIPVADQERLLAALKERAGIEPEKGDDGTLKANVPFINEVAMRFSDGYLYLARDAKHIAAKSLITPKAFFAKDDGAVLSVVFRQDRVPAELKEFVTGQLEHQLQEQLKKGADGDKPAAQKKLEAVLTDALVGSAKMLTEEGKEQTIKLFVDPKTDELSAEVTLTAKDGTALAKTIAGLAGKTSRAAGIVAAKDPVVRFASRGGLPADLRKRLDPVIDGLLEEAVNQAEEADRLFARRVADTFAPTLKAGELDAAATLSGPTADGKHTLLVALAVKDGKAIEKLAKDAAPHVPADKAEFSFDVETVGGFSLHKVEIKEADANFEKVFGTKTVWLATSDDLFALSVEPDGKALKAGLAAKPAAVPVLAVEVALAKAIPLFNDDLKPDEAKAVVKDAFGDANPAGKDTVIVTVEGGKQLTVKAKVKGKGVRLGASVSELKNK
ncbi:MAG: hypothetical protein K2X82_12520 [Gemmataceae bacterium]|nr:hypothetical protein [Gemmataceae bacterium]